MADYMRILFTAELSSVEGVKKWLAVLDTFSLKDLKEMQKRVAESQLAKLKSPGSQKSEIIREHKVMDEMLKGRINQFSASQEISGEKDYMGILFKAELSSAKGLMKWNSVLDTLSQEELREVQSRVAFSENARVKASSGSQIPNILREHSIMDEMLKARIKQFHDVIKNQAIDLTREPMKFVEPEALIAETHHDTKDSIDLNREPLRFAEPEALLAEIKPDSDEALMLEKEAAEAMLDYLKEMESSVDTDTESDESLSSLEDDDEAHADDVEDELPADKRFFALCREYLGGVTLSTNKLYQEFKALPDNAKENFLDAFENELARSKKQTSIPPVRAKTPKPVFDQEAAIKQAEIKIKTLVTDITTAKWKQATAKAEQEYQTAVWPRIQAGAAIAWEATKATAATAWSAIKSAASTAWSSVTTLVVTKEVEIGSPTEVKHEDLEAVSGQKPNPFYQHVDRYEGAPKTQDEINHKARAREVRELFGRENADIAGSEFFRDWSDADIKSVQVEILGIITVEIRENSHDATTLTDELMVVMSNNPERMEKTWLEDAKETVLGKARLAKASIGDFVRELKSGDARDAMREKADEAKAKIEDIKNNALDKIRDIGIKEKLTDAKDKVLQVVKNAGEKMGEIVDGFKNIKNKMANLRKQPDMEISKPTDFKHIKPER
jgi:hypothetical protein